MTVETQGGKTAVVSGIGEPVAEILIPYISEEFGPILRKHLPGLLHSIGEYLPKPFLTELAIEPSSPPENRQELLARTVDLLEELTAQTPLMLHVTGNTDNPIWETISDSNAKAVVLLERGKKGEDIELRELPGEAITAYTHGIFGEVDNDPELHSVITEDIGGNPSEFRRFLRDCVLSGALHPGTEKWEFKKEFLPAETPLKERWATLTKPAQFLASAVALAGELRADLAETLLEGDYFIASHKLLAAGFIIENAREGDLGYAPSPEIRKGIGDLLSTKESESVHRALAETYLAAEPGPGYMIAGAHHLELAGDPKAAFKSYFDAGTEFKKTHRYEKGETALSSAIRLLDFSPDTKTSITALKRLAICKKYLGDFEQAREAYYRALALAETTGDKQQAATILGDIGVTFFEGGDIQRAIELYERSLKLHREMANDKGELFDLVNLAGAYQADRDFERARAAYDKATPIADKLDNSLARCAITLNLAELDMSEGNLSEALPRILRAAAIARDNRYDQYLFEALLKLAELHRRQGKPTLAEKALSEASEIAVTLGKRAEAKVAIERAGQSRISGLLPDAAIAVAEANSMFRHLGKEEISRLLIETALLAAVTDEIPKIGLKIPHRPEAELSRDFIDALKAFRDNDSAAAKSALTGIFEKSKEINLEEIAVEASVLLSAIALRNEGIETALRELDAGDAVILGGNPYPRARLAETRAKYLMDAGETGAARSALSAAKAAYTELGNRAALDLVKELESRLETPSQATPGLEQLLPIIKALNSTLDTRELLSRIVDAVLETTSAERGLLFIVEGRALDLIIARNAGGKELSLEETKYSHGLVEQVLETQKPHLSDSVAEDGELSSRKSVIDLDLSMALCVPIIGRDGKPRGIIYADSRIGRGSFDRQTLEVLTALADQAAVALHNAERFDAIRFERDRMARELAGRFGEGSIIGETPQIQQLRERLAALAAQDISVLIPGETGTGKDLVARSIHAESTRKEKPFIAVNCAALPETLLESELFGHERGAFTGADKRHIGKFEQADGGVI
ncbi:hypothetical protein DRQ36_11135, partial [bacterium]